MRFLVSLVLSLAAYSYALPPDPQSKSTSAQQPAKADQRGTDTLPRVVKVMPTNQTDAEAAKESAERENKEAADWWLVKLTGALALIGAIQIFVFGLQARRLRQTVDAMGRQEKISGDSVEQMRRSADATAKSAEVSERALTTTQRALVFGTLHTTTHMTTKKGPTTAFSITAAWENSGATAATEVRSAIALKIVPKADTIPFFENEARGGFSVLGPRVGKGYSTTVTVPLATMMATWQGKQDVYVWARVEYRDLFSPTIHHHEFCVRVEWAVDPSILDATDELRYLAVGPQNTFG